MKKTGLCGKTEIPREFRVLQYMIIAKLGFDIDNICTITDGTNNKKQLWGNPWLLFYYPTIILPSGKISFLLIVRPLAMVSPKETGPMRPMYIQKIRAIFPQKCTTEVTPTLTPVVAKAETVSNRASRSVKVAASVTGPAKTTVVAIGIISKAKNTMANARNITFASTRRLRIIGSSYPG